MEEKSEKEVGTEIETEWRHPCDVGVTDQQKEKAFWNWKVHSVQFQADRLVAKTLKTAVPTIADPMLDWLAETEQLYVDSWLNVARTAMCLSGNEMAERLGIQRAAYYKIEQRERVGTIQLQTLEVVAEAMGCELVYAIRPRGATYSEAIWQSISKRAEKRLQVKHADPRIKDRTLVHAAKLEMERPEVRRWERWTERHRRQLKRN